MTETDQAENWEKGKLREYYRKIDEQDDERDCEEDFYDWYGGDNN
jgi:hypothetical protein